MTSELGSFTARALLARLQDEQRQDPLAFFAQWHKKDAGKQHQI